MSKFLSLFMSSGILLSFQNCVGGMKSAEGHSLSTLHAQGSAAQKLSEAKAKVSEAMVQVDSTLRSVEIAREIIYLVLTEVESLHPEDMTSEEQLERQVLIDQLYANLRQLQVALEQIARATQDEYCVPPAAQ